MYTVICKLQLLFFFLSLHIQIIGIEIEMPHSSTEIVYIVAVKSRNNSHPFCPMHLINDELRFHYFRIMLYIM
jgi:hypothetical protein